MVGWVEGLKEGRGEIKSEIRQRKKEWKKFYLLCGIGEMMS